MTKVAINTRFLLPNLEGLGTYTHEICRRMVMQNPEVEFHFLFDRSYDSKYIYAENVVPHVIYPPARHPLLWKIWFEWAIPRHLKRIGADAFFSPDNYCSLSTDVPTLMTTHDLAFEHYPEHFMKSHLAYFRTYSKLFHHRADKIACVSEYTREDIIDQYKIDSTKTFVTYNGCNRSFEVLSDKEKKDVKTTISDGKDYLLFVGAIHPRKNVERLVKAFELYKNKTSSNIKLILIGRKAWKTDNLMSTIESSLIKKDIVLLGRIENINNIISSATALCYPSLFEGFGIPVIEAFHAGVPVLTSNVSSMPEVAGNAAVLVDPKDINALAYGIKTIVHDTILRKHLISEGKKRTQLFSWNKSAEQIMNALKEIS